MTPAAGTRRAPIVDYRAVADTYQAVRAAVGAAGLAAALARTASEGWPLGLSLAGPALLVGLHALFRRRRPNGSPLPSVGVDGAAGALAVALGGLPAAAVAPVYLYLLTALFLLLPVGRAALAGSGLLGLLGLAFLAETVRSGSSLGSGQVALAVLPATLVAVAALVALFVVTSREVEASRARQAAALEAERKAGQMKNEFVSMVSHELRTPLTSIAGFAQTLRESWEALEEREVDEFLDIITDQSAHLSELVEDILVIPRLEAGRLRLDPSLFELRSAIYRVADVLFPAGGPKEASVDVQGGVMVWADESRVRQVLRNLLENAKKYGGDQVLIEGAPRGDRYMVVVSDNGPGIPVADRQRIFDPFEQLTKGDARRESGIGLGLPIARKLIRAMGGELWYEPRFPTGARFCFTLATHQTSQPAEGVASPARPPSGPLPPTREGKNATAHRDDPPGRPRTPPSPLRGASRADREPAAGRE